MRRGLWVLWALGAAWVPAIVSREFDKPDLVLLSYGLAAGVFIVAIVLNIHMKKRAGISARSGIAPAVEPHNESYMARTPSDGSAGRLDAVSTSLHIERVDTVLRMPEPDDFHLPPVSGSMNPVVVTVANP